MSAKELRLHVFMAHAGIASRRKCEEYIEEGKVIVNGKIISTPGYIVYPDDEVIYNGRRIYQDRKYVYLALNKPVGYICSMNDPHGRKLASDLIKTDYSGRLYNVGRLDFMSSGLLLFTNDGEFARYITHPSSKIEKEYLIETKENILEENLIKMKKGVKLKDGLYKIKGYDFACPKKVRIVLEQGRNRELRKLFSSFYYSVKKLQRVRIGPIKLGGIAVGNFRPLSAYEINKLKGYRNGSGN